MRTAVDEAIQRLGAGEAHLAVTHLCGTNIATTALLAGGAAMLAAGRSRRDNWPRALSAALLGTVAGARTGLAVQKHLTTDADIRGVRVRSVRAFGADDGRTQLLRVSLTP